MENWERFLDAFDENREKEKNGGGSHSPEFLKAVKIARMLRSEMFEKETQRLQKLADKLLRSADEIGIYRRIRKDLDTFLRDKMKHVGKVKGQNS